MLEFSEKEYASACSSPLHGFADLLPEEVSLATARTSGTPQAGSIVLIDALGNAWCEECRHRGELVNWGAAHAWQALEIHPYAMAEGAYSYQVAAAMGSDDMIWLMIGLIEMIETAREVA